MKQTLETNRIITGSLFIIATIAVSFILNFAQPFLVPLVLALLIRILIDPIIDYQIDYLYQEKNLEDSTLIKLDQKMVRTI